MKLALRLMIRADSGLASEAHLEGDLRLFRLVEMAGLSPFHFARAFRNDVGDPPYRDAPRRRIAR